MKKFLAIIILCTAVLGFSSCSSKDSTSEKNTGEVNTSQNSDNNQENKTDEKVNEDTNNDKKESITDDNVNKSNENNPSNNSTSFEDMKKLFVIEGQRSQENVIDGAFTYQISGVNYSDIVNQIKNGLKTINAKSISENDVANTYSFVGTYGDGSNITISVATSGADDIYVVSVAYGDKL